VYYLHKPTKPRHKKGAEKMYQQNDLEGGGHC